MTSLESFRSELSTATLFSDAGCLHGPGYPSQPEHGNSQAMHGRWEVASDYFLKAIETFQAPPHYESTMMGWPAANKGLMQWVLGDYEAAERNFLYIIEVLRKANRLDGTLYFKVLTNQKLKVFCGRQQYRQDLARSTYKASQVSFGSGNTSQADAELQDAFHLRQIFFLMTIEELMSSQKKTLTTSWYSGQSKEQDTCANYVLPRRALLILFPQHMDG
ncbi:hypothetical protein DL98DRAFT_536965 [Cadophora sp. DSE1049]|nr:hypothetical protein DL98DRAFT_536965 [Cadophora sp. DSE1049]